MKLEYDNKEEINWKEVKQGYDKEFMFFQLEFWHNGHKIQLHSQVNSKKSFVLMLYIDGVWKPEYGTFDKAHEYRKYHNKKLLGRDKTMKAMDALNKKQAKLLKRKYVEPEPMYYYTPIFDNIAQFQKMVENLTAK